jgi:hypothetical protein
VRGSAVYEFWKQPEMTPTKRTGGKLLSLPVFNRKRQKQMATDYFFLEPVVFFFFEAALLAFDFLGADFDFVAIFFYFFRLTDPRHF